MAQNENVIILGMHRSGTSCLTGMLRECGLYLGSVNEYTPFNKKGNQEHPLVMAINDELLWINDALWHEPRTVKYIPPEIANRIQLIKNEYRQNNALWGIKDPRMVFCYPAWQDDDSQFVGIFRHPHHVASSLFQRAQTGTLFNHFSLDYWMELWYCYNQEILKCYEENPFPLICFDWDSQRFAEGVNILAARLSLPNRTSHFYDSQLKTPRVFDEIQHEKHRETYAKLTRIALEEEKKLKEKKLKTEH
jgi:hypothetical protein